MSNPGHATISGRTVYYLYVAPTDTGGLKNEPRVLRAFLDGLNANTGVCHLISQGNPQIHPREPANQALHPTVYVCTDANWTLYPHESDCFDPYTPIVPWDVW
ncbi:hypothetical protein B0H10DRAFT_2198689 [Mycena sp. CBHHK59/15]|nr:hypothetical protein B0H10DRAFT_2198689 [Mycena sp. CBHHK59/15]